MRGGCIHPRIKREEVVTWSPKSYGIWNI